MNGISTTTTNHPVGVITSALRAIADHVDEHQLPFRSIQVKDDESAVLVWIAEEHVTVWVDSLHIDRVYDETFTGITGTSVHIFRDGRLPVGVRVQVATVHLVDGLGVPA